MYEGKGGYLHAAHSIPRLTRPTVSLDSPEDVGIGCSSSQLQELDMCTGIVHSN